MIRTVSSLLSTTALPEPRVEEVRAILETAQVTCADLLEKLKIGRPALLGFLKERWRRLDEAGRVAQ